MIGKSGQLANAFIQENLKFKNSIFPFSRHEINIVSESSIRKSVNIIKPDIIINTSGVHLNKQVEENPNNLFKINTISVGNLAKISKEFGIHFFTFSTNYVFDGEKSFPYSENDPPNPLQNYGVSKLGGEYLALNFNPGRSYVIRTSGIFGGEGSPEKYNFVLRILKEAKDMNKLEVSSEQVMSLTSANDLANAVLQIIKKRTPAGIFHLTNEGYSNLSGYAEFIVKTAKMKCRIIGVDRLGFSDGVFRPKSTVLKNSLGKKYGIILPNYKESLVKYIAHNEI